MHFGLDYDDTVTNDEELWDQLIPIFIERGHRVTIVTIRAEGGYNAGIKMFADFHKIPIVFTHGCQKETFTAAIGVNIDVWIDDSPLFIPQTKRMPGVILGDYCSGQSQISNKNEAALYAKNCAVPKVVTMKGKIKRALLRGTLKLQYHLIKNP
jgi:hypothetical protein